MKIRTLLTLIRSSGDHAAYVYRKKDLSDMAVCSPNKAVHRVVYVKHLHSKWSLRQILLYALLFLPSLKRLRLRLAIEELVLYALKVTYLCNTVP